MILIIWLKVLPGSLIQVPIDGAIGGPRLLGASLLRHIVEIEGARLVVDVWLLAFVPVESRNVPVMLALEVAK